MGPAGRQAGLVHAFTRRVEVWPNCWCGVEDDRSSGAPHDARLRRPSLLPFAGRARGGADAQEVGQMRLYIQQLEERVRQLTGQNERLDATS